MAKVMLDSMYFSNEMKNSNGCEGILYTVRYEGKKETYKIACYKNSKGEFHVFHIGEDGKEIPEKMTENWVPSDFYNEFTKKYGEEKMFELYILLYLDSFI